jgi:cullin 1
MVKKMTEISSKRLFGYAHLVEETYKLVDSSVFLLFVSFSLQFILQFFVVSMQIYVEMGKRYEVQGTNSNNKMNSTIDISLYCDDFETQFIAATVDYYSIASERWLADDGCPEYLRKAEAHIDEEHKRLHDFLNVTSEKKLMQGLYDTLLVKHQSVVLEQKQRCKNMLENNATQDLARMFSLYSNVPSTLPAIADIFKVYIQELGNGFLNTATPLITGKNEAAEQSARSQYIEQLMRIHSQNLLLVTTCFNGNTVFHKALKEAFEYVINQKVGETFMAELLSEYVL